MPVPWIRKTGLDFMYVIEQIFDLFDYCAAGSAATIFS